MAITLNPSETLAWARTAGVESADIERWRAGDPKLPLELAARIARAYRALFGAALPMHADGPPTPLALATPPVLR